ncbi:hypothetical protein niasHT_005448 [Heterodera trifolii]|uniref:Uncharacterized protein n=1 Tax=Heterodera trifolii TaxID=157864 RepID=A0ABD2M5D1_9BILA
MEVILNKLGNQPDLKPTDGLFEALQKAKNLPDQTKAFERRRKCVECFVMAFGTSKPKFASIAFEGVQLLLRGGASSAAEGQTPPGECLAGQLLSLFANIPSWREMPSTQCQCLTLLVQLISSPQIPIQTTEVLSAFEICKKTFELAADSASVRPAARAALTQMLNSYILNRIAIEENSESAENGASEDVAALLGELINRMGKAVTEVAEPNGALSGGKQSDEKADKRQPMLLPLDALFGVLSALDPQMIGRHSAILDRLKNELVPLIIWQLRGSAKRSEINENDSKRIGTQLMDTLKRAGTSSSTDCRPSGIVPVSMALEGSESAHSFYQVIDQLLRLLSPLALSLPQLSSVSSVELLPLLEELWRCALLSPTLSKRLEALRLAKRINGDEHRFVELLSLSIVTGKNSFWYALVECVEECGVAKCQRTVAASFRTLTAMFSTALNLFKQPPAEFKFEIRIEKLISAIKMNEKSDEEKEEAKSNEQMKKKGRREEKGTDIQMEKAAQLFSDSLVRLFRELETMDNCKLGQMDSAIQKIVVQICGQINAILCPMDGELGKSENEKEKITLENRKLSAQSTPEDSSEEEEGKERKKRREVTEMEIVEVMAQLMIGMGRQKANGRTKRRKRNGDGPTQTEGAEDEPMGGAGRNGDMPMDNIQMDNMPMDNIQQMDNENTSLVLMELVTRNLCVTNCDSLTLAIHHLLNLSAFDPLLEQLASDGNANGSVFISPSHFVPLRSVRMALFQWFRTEIRNCWSSFVRLFSLFKEQNELSEESKNALIEALATFVPLAIEMGMAFELHWVYQLIAEQMCPLEHLREAVKNAKRSGESANQKSARRFCGQISLIGLRVLLENAPAALRIAPKLSSHIVRCAQFVWELERWHFQMSKLVIAASVFEPTALLPQNLLRSPAVDPLIAANAISADELTSTEIARLMEDFLAMIDRIFSSAISTSLPLNSFCSLINSICTANENNLFYSDDLVPIESSAQLLQRMCQLVAGSGNLTLIHKIAAFRQIRAHLIKCASANSIPREVNRRAIDGVQEVIKALLQMEWPSDQPRMTIFGWNSFIFSAFSQIVGSDSLCVSETFLQVGQVLLSFVGQFNEMICSAWGPLFGTIQQLIRRNVKESPNCPLVALILDIFEKFLSISKPFVLLIAFSDFVDALSLFLSLSIDDNSSTFDQLVSLLERSECILIDFLFTASIELPLAFIEMIDRKWEDKRKIIMANGQRNADEADYVNQLTDLRMLLSDQREGIAEGCPIMAKWLDEGEGGAEVESGQRTNEGLTWPANLPICHLSPTSPCKAVALHSFNLLQQLLKAMLNNRNNCSNVTNQSRLTLNFGHFLGELSAKFDTPFASFCFCAVLSADVGNSLALPLSASGVRCLKLLLVPLLAHRSVVLLLAPSPLPSLWRFFLLRLLLRLSVRCVAKGGNLSLVGCALLRNFCALSNDCPFFASLCADAIWHSIHYTLFPVRLLISQFFVHSTDFSSDLGKMRVSYRLGLKPAEVEECVDKVNKLANQAFQTEEQREGKLLGESGERGEGGGGAHFPSKFAYLFIFESGAIEKAENGMSQKLSLGVEQLVDSVLCQQLLVQLISEQLNSNDSLTIGPLLASLNATLTICEQFELRPGLKSLIQKLTGLRWPANLWHLFVFAMHSLLRWHLRQMLSEENEQKMAYIKRVELLLRRAICGGEGKSEKGKAKGKGRETEEEERTNPFISQRNSGQSAKQRMPKGGGGSGDLSEETLGKELISSDCETHSAALSRLFDLFASDILTLLGKEDIGRMKRMLVEIEMQIPKERGESEGTQKKLRDIIERLEVETEEKEKKEEKKEEEKKEEKKEEEKKEEKEEEEKEEEKEEERNEPKVMDDETHRKM